MEQTLNHAFLNIVKEKYYNFMSFNIMTNDFEQFFNSKFFI